METARALDLPRHPALRGPEPQRRRRHARGPRSASGSGLRGIPVGCRRRHGGARHPPRRTHRRPLSRRPHLHHERRRHGRLRQAAGACRSPAKPRRTTSPSTRRRHAALRLQLQDEAAAALRAATSTAVIDGVVSGAVDCLATDHAPHAGDDKMQEFERCPFGIIGLETALGISLEVLVHTGRITLINSSPCTPPSPPASSAGSTPAAPRPATPAT